MQTLRNRVLSILKGETPDRLPWFGDLSYWHFSMSRRGTLEKKYTGFEGLLNLHRDLNVGYYLQGYFPFITEYNNCSVTEVERSASGYDNSKGVKIIEDKDNKDFITEISTPLGTIKEKWPYLPDSFTWAPKEYLIKTEQDLKVFKYWLDNTSYKFDYEKALKVKEEISDIGLNVCYQPRSPLVRLMIMYIGVNNTINFMMDYKKLFYEVIKVLEYRSDEAAEITLNSPAEIIMIPENLSSDIVGKNFFEEYLRPYEEKWNKKIKSRGKYSLIHFDGYLKGLLKEVSSTGFSIIEAMTPKPAGDLEVSEFRDYVGDDTICWGGIPGGYFTPLVSNREFEEFILKVIKIMVSEPKYVLGIADQIPPDGIIERVKVVSDFVEKYGFYYNNQQ